jgi:hypothetical protein
LKKVFVLTYSLVGHKVVTKFNRLTVEKDYKTKGDIIRRRPSF